MQDISSSDIPSKKHYNILKNAIHYSEIYDMIEKKESLTKIEEWVNKLNEYLEQYLRENSEEWPKSNANKRCRDFNYTFNFLLQKLKDENAYSDSYSNFEGNINNYAKIHLQTYSENCERTKNVNTYYYNDEDENRKNVDDFCEDATFINSNITKINSSPYCQVIKVNIEQDHEVLDAKVGTDKEKYTDTLKFYGFSTFDSLKDIIQKINCNTYNDAPMGDEEDNPDGIGQLSGHQVSIVVILSLLGILCICFFLYKTTPFGPWLNILLRKKKKIFGITSLTKVPGKCQKIYMKIKI
ncbi:PIR Superfamily Protein [Plasmodium ovale wallikeri]|uniref:PIR Superfamily Protein n=1 Tax=Plasmodium ovale wallikeri TaxID=864142 RepID=A0A1A9AQ41_PLAOA|nr:PIR Superfamily Protein [Plasmodium ovale wallikeri]SBT58352.1 PIR Superfamily Protein [Plasmodium ovale wallikeri]